MKEFKTNRNLAPYLVQVLDHEKVAYLFNEEYDRVQCEMSGNKFHHFVIRALCEKQRKESKMKYLPVFSAELVYKHPKLLRKLLKGQTSFTFLKTHSSLNNICTLFPDREKGIAPELECIQNSGYYDHYLITEQEYAGYEKIQLIHSLKSIKEQYVNTINSHEDIINEWMRYGESDLVIISYSNNKIAVGANNRCNWSIHDSVGFIFEKDLKKGYHIKQMVAL